VAEFYEPGEPLPPYEPAEGEEPFQVVVRWADEPDFDLTIYAADRQGAELRLHEMMRKPEYRGIVEGRGEPDRVEVWTPEEYLTRE
jgi:hypothetical protein